MQPKPEAAIYARATENPFTVHILDEYFLPASHLSGPRRPANSRHCDGGDIQPHGGDSEYRCYWCSMVWSRDEERPPCPEE